MYEEPATAPPRFAYESDSSASEFDDDDLATSKLRPPKRPRRAAPRIELQWHGEAGASVFVLSGEAGEAWTRGLTATTVDAGRLDVDGQQVASLRSGPDVTLVLASPALSLDAQTPVAAALLAALKPSRLRVIDSYSLQNYLGDADEEAPPLRFLQTVSTVSESDRLRLYDVPNLVTGLSAALMVQAAHADVDALLLLCPSFAAGSSLHSATTHLRRRPSGIYDPSETGDDDEAFAAPARLFAGLSESERGALGWTNVWRNKGSSNELWAWLRVQERDRGRQKGEYEELYL